MLVAVYHIYANKRAHSSTMLLPDVAKINVSVEVACDAGNPISGDSKSIQTDANSEKSYWRDDGD